MNVICTLLKAALVNLGILLVASNPVPGMYDVTNVSHYGGAHSRRERSLPGADNDACCRTEFQTMLLYPTVRLNNSNGSWRPVQINGQYQKVPFGKCQSPEASATCDCNCNHEQNLVEHYILVRPWSEGSNKLDCGTLDKISFQPFPFTSHCSCLKTTG